MCARCRLGALLVFFIESSWQPHDVCPVCSLSYHSTGRHMWVSTCPCHTWVSAPEDAGSFRATVILCASLTENCDSRCSPLTSTHRWADTGSVFTLCFYPQCSLLHITQLFSFNSFIKYTHKKFIPSFTCLCIF